jgi:hypothetical protein
MWGRGERRHVGCVTERSSGGVGSGARSAVLARVLPGGGGDPNDVNFGGAWRRPGGGDPNDVNLEETRTTLISEERISGAVGRGGDPNDVNFGGEGGGDPNDVWGGDPEETRTTLISEERISGAVGRGDIVGRPERR